MKAMIFAAGFGTRLKPWTEKHPKALFPINEKPLLQRNIEYLKKYGIHDFVINIHYFADQIKDFITSNHFFNSNIEFSDETDMILETGGGLVKAKSLLGNEDFLVMNADILTDLNLKNLIEYHQKNNPIATLAVTDRPSSRQLFFSDNYHLKGWGNINTQEIKGEKTEKSLAFSGIHIISPEIFNFMPKNGKFSIIDSYLNIMNKQLIMGYEHSEDKLIDVGKPENVEDAEKWFK